MSLAHKEDKPMLIDELTNSSVMKFTADFFLDHEPNTLGICPVCTTFVDGNRSRPNICGTNRPGALEMTFNMADLSGMPELDYNVTAEGSVLGTSSGGAEPVIRWTIPDIPLDIDTRISGFPCTVTRTAGQFTTSLRVLEPIEDDADPFCPGGTWRFHLGLRTVSSPDGIEDWFIFEIDTPLGHLTATASELRLDARAGLSAAALLDRLRVVELIQDEDRLCVSPSTRRVGLTVKLDAMVRNSHTRGADSIVVEARATATPTGGGAETPLSILPTSIQVPIGRDRARFSIEVPGDFSGEIRVSARASAADMWFPLLFIVSPDLHFCREPDDSFRYRFSNEFPECPACLIHLINNYGDLAGMRNGVGFRRLSAGQAEFFGALSKDTLRPLAINDAGVIIGSVGGTPHSFIYEEAKGVRLIEHARLQAMNAEGVGVGYRMLKEQQEAVTYREGKIEPLDIYDAAHSVATAINDNGQIACAVARQEGGIRALRFEGSQWIDLGDLGGDINIPTAINNRGATVGVANTAYKEWRGFFSMGKYYSKVHEIPPLKGFRESIASDINDSGLVVGTSYSGAGQMDVPSRGFIYSAEKGTRDLNDLLKSDDVIVHAALKITNAGVILVRGISEGRAGTFLLTPQLIR